MERIVAKNGVVFYRSELIPCPHGFSTRIGGVSKLPHTRGLNLGVDRGDGIDTVTENLRLFAEAVGFDYRQIISVPQIHSDKIRRVTADNAGEGLFRQHLDTCDGYVATTKNIVLGVRTADCVPILLYAPPRGDFGGAVMALHAGWRGTAARIAEKAVERAVSLGAAPEDIKAAIGPAIEKCCYCVRSDFYDGFTSAAGTELAEKYVLPSNREEGVWYADLKGANREILLGCGLSENNIDVSDTCTCCHPEEFYSHRYTKGVRGSMLSVITFDKT